MSYANIRSRITISNYPVGSNFPTIVDAALQSIYDGSPLAAQAFDSWLASNPSKNIDIQFSAGNAQALAGKGIVQIDPSFFSNNYYISTTGKAVQDTFVSGFTHELGHALTGKRDIDSFSKPAGANQDNVNDWFAELGFSKQVSYEAYDTKGFLTPGKEYTQGNSIDFAIIDIGLYQNGSFTMDTSNIDLDANGVRGPSLIIGGSGANNYGGTKKNDWVYGAGGTDSLDGNNGADHLYGGNGDDIIHGGAANDYLYGDGEISETSLSGKDKLYGDAGDDYLFGGLGSDELHGGSGTNRLEGGDGADKLVAEGRGDTLDGGGGNDIFELNTRSATIEFGRGDGSDLVQFDLKHGDYTLKLKDLNANDIDIIGGGFSAYNVNRGRSGPDGPWYQFLTIRDKATGDQVTFLEDGIGGVTNIGPDAGGGLPKVYNKDVKDQGQLDTIMFQDGSFWDQHTIWENVSRYDLWAYSQGSTLHGYGSAAHDETNYVDYVNQTYLQAFGDFGKP